MERAAGLGVRVVLTHMPDGLLGGYSPLEGRVYLDLGLTPSERRSVLARELGHVYYGHTCDQGPTSLLERQADTYAATLLVHPEDYAALERISADAHYIAEELNVTPDVVYAFRRHVLQRLGERTYAGRRPFLA
ncbi:ImmA/IrrE family metallo-endopeptidase [Curtobacterium sp. MCPF17_001]|uniref:ImmA/IrrE family metallo-endopeptidase n=1 Tax=Curtobacterium sp. MCPF17_001 TaxID=2175651 RepID=UPI000DA7BC34|nr:ImmA/IrrE family metallo-endopeptidase [Curtobacterium sp. MCPF17_001]PZE59791.1 ImmA/IrrE family metallo-endopeptidase [Curtobacterium sp. MCPF17_001]